METEYTYLPFATEGFPRNGFDLSRDLDFFSCADAMRANLALPADRDGYTWASDGRIILRTEIGHYEGVKLDQSVLTPPDFNQAIKYWDLSGARPLAEVLTYCAELACPDCKGFPYVLKTDWRGQSLVDAHGCSWWECKICGGDGRRRLQDGDKRHPWRLFGRTIHADYAFQLLLLPNVMVADTHREEPLCGYSFSFNGGIGMVMGMKEAAR